MKENDSIQCLLETIEKCVSPYHVVKMSQDKLDKAGYTELAMNDDWDIKEDGKYYVNVFDSSLVSFNVGKMADKGNIRIATAHNDFPCLRIKPKCEVKESGYLKLNVEVYGGAI